MGANEPDAQAHHGPKEKDNHEHDRSPVSYTHLDVYKRQGNDYARTLGISARSVDEAVRQLAGAHPRPFDVGRCNGRHFVETLSFGLDAAIALDTVERRRVTGKTGTALYLESGLDQLLHHRDAHRFAATLDAGQVGAAVPPADAGQVGEGPGFERTPEGAAAAQGAACAKAGTRTVDGPSYLFAVQIGPTYGCLLYTSRCV